MSNDVVDDPPPVPPAAGTATPMPICPYCMKDPAMFSCRGPMQLGAFYVVIIFCGNPECRKVWNVNITGMEQPRISQPPLSLS